VSSAGGRRHDGEAELLAFCAKEYQTSDYVRRTAEFIKAEYPGSAATLLPKLRALFREKTLKERREFTK